MNTRYTTGAGDTEAKWSTAPTYETKSNRSTSLIIRDSSGVDRKIYDESYAVLFVEEHYSNGWSPPITQGERSTALIKRALELRGYHVLVWRDLKGEQFQTTLNEILSNIGYRNGARLFFYYFGHGTALGTVDDDEGPRTFLVPIDAADPNVDQQAFYRSAIPISRLTEIASAMTLKHAFFALEACNAGGIISTLGLPPPPNAMGYIFGETVKKHVRQFLTAGNEREEVPSGIFSALLVGAFDEGSRNGDGYVTGYDVISYVTRHTPQYTKDFPLNPAYGSLPPTGGGDMIIGPSIAKLEPSVETDVRPDKSGVTLPSTSQKLLQPLRTSKPAPATRQHLSPQLSHRTKHKERAATRTIPSKPASSATNVTKSKSSGNCFRFNGQNFCE
ncbi:caspase family protein [Mesorhizobium dulcispinae]|uniref:caspase family protein n=1 Tax=Mesorhizobium dulcispinae TaxID=3072316 RepID=UPI002A2427FF|nr:caspase family protein [Mesorhizobium sp. VK23D]MDX8520470.1 caspase family protein [Mesorhizobium sp. VK23D]